MKIPRYPQDAYEGLDLLIPSNEQILWPDHTNIILNLAPILPDQTLSLSIVSAEWRWLSVIKAQLKKTKLSTGNPRDTLPQWDNSINTIWHWNK